MKGKPMDNLEFLQWLKGFYDEQTTNLPYNAEARRRGLGYPPAAATTFRPPRPPVGSRSPLPPPPPPRTTEAPPPPP